jgi:hypothetical protein
VKARHRADLVWRFQHAEEQPEEVPSALAVLADACTRGSVVSGVDPGACAMEARVSARERVTRIDWALGRLRTKPVSLARVLRVRYRARAGGLSAIDAVLRGNAAVAPMTREAAALFAEEMGMVPRPRSHDVGMWLGVICLMVRARRASRADAMILEEIRRAAERLLGDAERAYEAVAERARAS